MKNVAYGLAQRGAVLPLIAITLAVLMGAAGMAIDIGFLEYQQQAQQAATDAAAAGGAEAASTYSCANGYAASSAAVADAAMNGYAASYVSATSPPASGPYAGVPCAVSVTINAGKQTFFSRIFGFNSMQESTTAVGVGSLAQNAGCIYLLSTGITTIFNGNTINTNCKIYDNGNPNWNNSTITSPYIGVYGSQVGHGTFPSASPAPMATIADPCSKVSGCAYLTANPPSTSNCTSYSESSQTVTVPSGCYSSINLQHGTVTFTGQYVFTGGFTDVSATITSGSAGSTWYVTSTGSPPNFNNGTVTLSAPTSGNDFGVAYYQVPSNSGNPNFNNASVGMTGLVYAPGSNGFIFNGSAGAYTILVAGSANFNGGTTIGTPPPGHGIFGGNTTLGQ